MNICVINGSPKGDYSITLQTVLFLEKRFPEHKFIVINASRKIRYYKEHLDEIVKVINESKLIIFSYPVYTFIAPSQLHLLIQYLKEKNLDLSDKYVTQITTSKHFYDITAHKYIEDNCFDMKAKVIHGLSSDMEDLLTKKGQNEAIAFFKYICFSISNDIYEKRNEEIKNQSCSYVSKDLQICEKNDKFDTVIVTDLSDNDDNLKNMIIDFQNIYPYKTRLVNINSYPFMGGCLGCFNCASDGKCIYKDGFDVFLRENIQKANAIVYAFKIKDHSMGARFKMYDDRQFCNGHRTVTENIPFAYIIDGNYNKEENLKMIIEARCEVGHNYLSGIGTDYSSIIDISKKLTYALENKLTMPRNFYGVGGMKIFRDLIWLMRGLMKADHQYYKKHGVYDFPQKKRMQMIKMCLLGSLVRNKKIKAKMGNKMDEGMIAPYKKVINKVEGK